LITLTSAQLNAWLAALLWPLARILALVSVAPILGSQQLPLQVKIGLGLLITIVVVPTLGALPEIDPASLAGLLILVQQMLVGLAMGFAMRLVFAAVEMAGELAGLQMGLGFAVFYDPQSAGHTAVIGQFLGILTSLIFLALNGHLVLFSVLAESFTTLPISSGTLSALGWHKMAGFGAKLFLAALLMALPIIITMLITNLALGVLTRAAPQLNVFAIGFPITLSIGLALLALALPYLLPQFERLMQDGFGMILQFEGAARGR
jgi:flagellar biosynthetic protein FliR